MGSQVQQAHQAGARMHVRCTRPDDLQRYRTGRGAGQKRAYDKLAKMERARSPRAEHYKRRTKRKKDIYIYLKKKQEAIVLHTKMLVRTCVGSLHTANTRTSNPSGNSRRAACSNPSSADPSLRCCEDPFSKILFIPITNTSWQVSTIV